MEAAVTGPYVNEEGDIWIERGSVPWPQARREAWSVTDTGWTWAEVGLVYEGIDHGILVSDENEAPCENAPDCMCCRRIDAYHFRTIER